MRFHCFFATSSQHTDKDSVVAQVMAQSASGNYSAWEEAIVRDFTIRRAKWILSGRLAGDDELNEIALSVLQGSLSTQFKYLLDGSTCVKTAFESTCNHAESQMKACVTLLEKDLSNLSQGSMTTRDLL
jgi:hypothetical protein